ncbi:glycosyl hydrolase [Actinorhabdospora filicis]|uniref:Glycosyl hydrolase n=1 Tax=Actinorhabdospora filicis TaxID=1785913 RepID=A0A9W6SJK1_9ACTN|nr:family 10 glycosylhydrolase [Actinorhabdospora filicis]GLZ77130.1 glycosyl hydrolase [Actinorhabdospora filicis]
MPTEGTSRRTLFRAGAGVGAAALSAAAVAGSATAAHAEDATSAVAPNPAFPKHELRSTWVSTVVNIDWPSKQGLDAATQKAELLRWLDESVAAGFNTVVFQVRPTSDAFWPSPYEPWSRWITGTQGKDPGYDPLGFAVEEAHKRGLELHAWFNPFRISMKTVSGDVGTDISKLADGHPAKAHPEWVLPYPKTNGQLFYDPGIPEAREHIVNAICHAAENYDIDGVHFDDYFYPYPSGTIPFEDDATFAKYGAGFPNKAAWRRSNVDAFVKAISDRLRANAPGVKFGISPSGVWRNKADDPVLGSDTRAGAPTYDALHADTRKWVKENWIDYIVPQVYWANSLAVASYNVIVNWWNETCAGTDVDLYIGEATYKVNASTQSPEWNTDPHELDRHVQLGRDLANVSGNIYFSAKDVRANQLNAMGIIKDAYYQRPALVPPSASREATPRKPKLIDADRRRDGSVELCFRSGAHHHHDDTTAWYAVWRFEGRDLPRHWETEGTQDATNLIARVNAEAADGSFVDTTADPKKHYSYAITPYNRNGVAGPISGPKKV